jgi:hypothetical protein
MSLKQATSWNIGARFILQENSLSSANEVSSYTGSPAHS